MNNIEKITDHLSLDIHLKELVLNKISIPVVDDYNFVKDYWYAHPPSLIPLFLGYGASYKGILHHFFTDRKNTFVEYYLEHGYISEIARNPKQFLTLLLLKMIIIEDELTDRIVDFSKNIGYNNLNEVDNFVLEYGDDPKDFDKLIFFDNNPPFKYLKDISKYDGDYPCSLNILNNLQLQNTSSFEVSNMEFLKPFKNIPQWLNPTNNKKDLFDNYLEEGSLKEAWFTLNSEGWLLKDVANALEIFKSKTDDHLFHLVADNWINGWQNSNAKSEDSY